MTDMTKWETDKNLSGLFKAYEEIFRPLQSDPVKYLEVGIARGDSLRWAKGYFHPESKIYGIDIGLPEAIEGVTMELVDQNDSEGLYHIGNAYGKFDLIIDDGSHQAKETLNTFDSLRRYLTPEGVYIIEDWGADLVGKFPNCYGMSDLVKRLVWLHGGSMVRVESGGCFAIIGRNTL